MAEATLYEILGVGKTASAQEIRSAYRRTLQAVHPDHGGNRALFESVRDAYGCLSDPDRRAAYDRMLDLDAPGATCSSAGASGAANTDPAYGGQQGRTGDSQERAASTTRAATKAPRSLRLRSFVPAHPSSVGLGAAAVFIPAALATHVIVWFGAGALFLSLGIVGLCGHLGSRLAPRARLAMARAMSEQDLRMLVTAVLQEFGFPVLRDDGTGLIVRGKEGDVLVYVYEHSISRRLLEKAQATRRELGVSDLLVVSLSDASYKVRRFARENDIVLWDGEGFGEELMASRSLPSPAGVPVLKAELVVGFSLLFKALSGMIRQGLERP
jgi:hypothetical protein